MNIKTKQIRIKAKLEKLHQDLEQLQAECPHEDLHGKYGANTGNYDPSDNAYWVDFHCQDCGKRWTEEQKDVRVGVSKDGIKFTKV